MTREEYEKEHRRLCDVYYPHCERCVLSKWCENSDTVKDYYSVINEAYDIVQVVEKWAQEHPIQTNADKFKDVFGKDIVQGVCI